MSLAFYEQRTARPEVKEFVDMSDYRGTICDGDDCSLDLPAGGYILQYDVTDAYGASTSDDMTVTITAETNDAPTADAGSDQDVTVVHDGDPSTGTIDVDICGSGSDPEDDTISLSWSSGENTACISKTLTAGEYSYSLTVTDAYGASHSDEMSVTDNAEPNDEPVVTVGEDQDIVLPHDHVLGGSTLAQISGYGTNDPEGDDYSISWSNGVTDYSQIVDVDLNGSTSSTTCFTLTATDIYGNTSTCLLYTSPSPRDRG